MQKPKGLLHPTDTLERIQLAHHPVPDALAPAVSYFWEVSWDLREQTPYKQSNLPHPSQHIVLHPGGESGLRGIHTGRFEITLQDRGRVLGVRLRPGALCAFRTGQAAELNDRCIA